MKKDAGRKLIDTLKTMNALVAVANAVASKCLDTTEAAPNKRSRHSPPSAEAVEDEN